MENKWAADHLQVIRTLMERSALYRRALAPIMLVSGAMGLAAALLGRLAAFNTLREFVLFWMAVAALSLGVALVLTRRQALKEAEPFWSLPTQRVASGLFPCFLTGLGLALVALLHPAFIPAWLIVSLWILNYACALRAAGFFMQRGIKLFGTAFLVGGLLILLSAPFCPWLIGVPSGHCVMGLFFGAGHLAYGVYLYFTEQKPNA
jgi:hypothetical protein